MSALLALGPHIFEILPLNYQELDRTSTAAWASIPRFGGRAARQFTGLGEGDGMTISGVIFPEEFGGRAQYEAIRFTQGLGVPLMMVGLGAVTGARIFGLVCVESVSDTQTHIAPNGQGRVLDFSIDVTPYGGGNGGVLGGLF